MLGASLDQVVNAVSNAWIDGGALAHLPARPNTGFAQELGAGDATSRAVRHALIALTGETGYPSALSAKTWGFLRRALQGQGVLTAAALRQLRPLETCCSKISYPPEFHARRRSRRR